MWLSCIKLRIILTSCLPSYHSNNILLTIQQTNQTIQRLVWPNDEMISSVVQSIWKYFSRMLSLPGRAHLEQVLDLASHQLHHHLHHHLPTRLCIQTRRKRRWNVLNSSSYWGKLWQKLNWFNLVFSRTSDDVSTVVNWLPSRLSKNFVSNKINKCKTFLA